VTDDLFERVLLPVGDDEDAETTCRAVRPHIEAVGGHATAVHVIEKAGGAPDKASVEQRELAAEEMFEVVHRSLAGIDVATEIAYGTDVAETIFDVADEIDATAIVFTPRSGSRWVRLLTGDVALDLITRTDRPVVVLPDDDAEGEA
jgi:nucleotide-binding universal stress UspA family protein